MTAADRDELRQHAARCRKWAANLRPAPDYLSPAALARELLRLAERLDIIAMKATDVSQM